MQFLVLIVTFSTFKVTFIFYQKYFLGWNGLKAFLFSCYDILNGFRTTSGDIFPVSSRTFCQSKCRFTVCYTYIFYYSQVKTYGFQFSWNQRYWVISSAIESFKGSVDNHRHVVCLWPREQVSPHFLWKRKLFDTVSFSGNPFYFMHNLLYCKAIRLLETAVCT